MEKRKKDRCDRNDEVIVIARDDGVLVAWEFKGTNTKFANKMENVRLCLAENERV